METAPFLEMSNLSDPSAMRSNPCYDGVWTSTDKEKCKPAAVDQQTTEQDDPNVYEEPERATKEDDRVTKKRIKPVFITGSSNDPLPDTDTSARNSPLKADQEIPSSTRNRTVFVILLLVIAVALTLGITSLILHLNGSGTDSSTPGRYFVLPCSV